MARPNSTTEPSGSGTGWSFTVIEHRNLGPWMSPRMRTSRPSSAAVLRMHRMSSSNWPGCRWEELRRKTSTPAWISFLIISGLDDAGPSVATILPLRLRKSVSGAASRCARDARSDGLCLAAKAVWPPTKPVPATGALAVIFTPPASRLARYSANDSALWMACCLPLGSLGSATVGSLEWREARNEGAVRIVKRRKMARLRLGVLTGRGWPHHRQNPCHPS